MTIFNDEGFHQKSKIVWVFSNIWRLEWVMGTKFAINVSMKGYWMLYNARFTSFNIYELFKENQEGGMESKNLLHTPTHLDWKPVDMCGK